MRERALLQIMARTDTWCLPCWLQSFILIYSISPMCFGFLCVRASTYTICAVGHWKRFQLHICWSLHFNQSRLVMEGRKNPARSAPIIATTKVLRPLDRQRFPLVGWHLWRPIIVHTHTVLVNLGLDTSGHWWQVRGWWISSTLFHPVFTLPQPDHLQQAPFQPFSQISTRFSESTNSWM